MFDDGGDLFKFLTGSGKKSRGDLERGTILKDMWFV
jgi:hypothetical protein